MGIYVYLHTICKYTYVYICACVQCNLSNLDHFKTNKPFILPSHSNCIVDQWEICSCLRIEL